MSEKQRNQILEQAESQFQDVLQKARQAFDMIDDNAETMDGASGIDDMTAYEAVMQLFNEIYGTGCTALGDLCASVLHYAVQARKDAD